MGGTESSDKAKDMTVSEHIADMFRESPYKIGSYPTSSKDSYRYGEADYLDMAYDKMAVRKRIRVKDDRQFTVFVKNKVQRMQFDENLFVRMLDYDCGVMPEDQTEEGQYKFYIDVYFDFYENDLRREIENRRSSGHYFSSEELSKLVEFFIKAGTFLDTSDNRHGDLRPEYVCITEEGRFLLQENVRDKPGTGPRIAYMSSIDLYCSPALYKGFCKNVMKVKRDKAKDDVFSAGMIILEAGLLESKHIKQYLGLSGLLEHPTDVYNQDLGKIDSEALNARFERFEESYGTDSKLCDNLRKFLVVDEIDRPYFKDIATANKPQARTQTQAYNNTGYGNQGYTAGAGLGDDGYRTTALTGNAYGVSNGYQNQYQYGQPQAATSYGSYGQPTAVSGGYSYGQQYDTNSASKFIHESSIHEQICWV